MVQTNGHTFPFPMLKYAACITVYLLFVQQVLAQHKGKYQYRWAMIHPIAAIKVQRIYKKNHPIYLEIKQKAVLDTFEHGGKLDAFRHAFFMACFAQKIKPRKLIQLGIAHEKDDYAKKPILTHADTLNTTMDLYNNTIGIELGRKYRKLAPQQLKDTIIQYILNNKLKIIYLK